MSYQVLARKWRPQTFSELVGQQHVVDAITNALENDKLHHAYLFTGTRGVGKTTIARIFSKSLNCEQGQSANPCGKCNTCVDISDGRYVDLLEIDAASRTKVEDTRELLDNVQYRPTRGKYKVYLIDEVHMLSKHSFNALLKTLEEPPEHVKFLLATTDPQKLPVTVLSRCLQFSLKALTKEQIQGHLEHILTQEQIPFEIPALTQLARAAQGSIRDSLSLTDQAIAQGNNQVNLATVVNMLGLLNKNHILKLVKFICERDSANALAQLDEICGTSPDYPQVLAQILGLLHQIALTQVVPEICKLESESAKGVYTLAKALSKEHVQLLYQMCLNGKRDLPHAPDARVGLEMTVLRMLAFTPMQKIELDVDALLSDEHADLPMPQIESTQQVDTTLTPSSAKQITATPKLDSVEHVEPVSQLEPVPGLEPAQSLEPAQALESGFQFESAPQLEPSTKIEATPQAEPIPEAASVPVIETIAPTDVPKTEHTALTEKQDRQQNGDSSLAGSLNKPTELIASDSLFDSAHSQQFEQDQFADEAPPMVDDMFGDIPPQQHFPHAEEQSDYGQFKAQQPASDVEHADQASNAQALHTDSDNTLQLIENNKKLRQLRAEQEDESGKKLEPEVATAVKTAVSQTYKLGDTFTAFKETDYAQELPAFLPNGDKLILAAQVDEWSAFVDSTGLNALTRQLLIHANCDKISNPLVLKVDQEISHLVEPETIERIQSAISELCQDALEVAIEYENVEDTPFQIQARITQMRQQHAEHIVATEPAIQELIKAFDANVIKDSIEAR